VSELHSVVQDCMARHRTETCRSCWFFIPCYTVLSLHDGLRDISCC